MAQTEAFGRQELVSRLRQHLSELSPDSHQTLMRTIDRARTRGEKSPVHGIILEALRDVVADGKGASTRVPSAERALFHALNPFLTSHTLPEKQVGRIDRSSLRPIWVWITRDLAPGRCDAELAALRAAVVDEDDDIIEEAAHEFRAAICKHAKVEVEKHDQQHGSLQRLEGQLGNPRILSDLLDVVAIFEKLSSLTALMRHMPTKLPAGQASLDTLAKYLRTYEKTQGADMIYAYAAVVARLGNVSDLVRFAVWHAKSSNPAIIRKTTASGAVQIALSEASMDVERLRSLLEDDRDIQKVTLCLRRFDDLVSSIARTLDDDPSDPWLKRLSAIRARVSDLMTKELEPLLHMIKRTITVVEARGAQIPPDPASIQEAVFGARLFMVARDVRSTLAINALIERTEKGIEDALESQGKSAIDRLDCASEQNWPAAVARSQAAVELFRVYYGGNYGASMARRHAAQVETHALKQAS